MREFSEWMRSVADAAMPHCVEGGDEFYLGVEGAKRMARECGPAIWDFKAEKEIGSTYSGICVIAYSLKPPIDAKTWITEVRHGYERYRRMMDERAEAQHRPRSDAG